MQDDKFNNVNKQELYDLMQRFYDPDFSDEDILRLGENIIKAASLDGIKDLKFQIHTVPPNAIDIDKEKRVNAFFDPQKNTINYTPLYLNLIRSGKIFLSDFIYATIHECVHAYVWEGFNYGLKNPFLFLSLISLIKFSISLSSISESIVLAVFVQSGLNTSPGYKFLFTSSNITIQRSANAERSKSDS